MELHLGYLAGAVYVTEACQVYLKSQFDLNNVRLKADPYGWTISVVLNGAAPKPSSEWFNTSSATQSER
jgi:hypothetical protein